MAAKLTSYLLVLLACSGIGYLLHVLKELRSDVRKLIALERIRHNTPNGMFHNEPE